MRKISGNWLDTFLKYTRKIEPPEIFLLWSALWAISAVIGRKAWLDFGYYKTYPNIYTVLTGPPASRKSTAIRIAEELVTEIDGVYLGPNMTTKEALIKKLAASSTPFEVNGERHDHSSLAIVSPEWSDFMGEQDRDLCNALCELYDCAKKFDKWTKTQGEDHVKNVFLTMLGGSTIKQITDCLPYASIGGGFTSRIVFVVGDEAKHKRNALPSFSEAEPVFFNKLVNDLQHINENIVGEFNLTKGGRKEYTDWYMNRTESIKDDDKFIHYADRKPTHALKLAMLLTASRDDSMNIGAGEVHDSIRFLNELEGRMPEALGGVGLSKTAPVIAKIRERLRQHKKLSVSRLQMLMWADANKDELSMAIETMKPELQIDDKGRISLK